MKMVITRFRLVGRGAPDFALAHGVGLGKMLRQGRSILLDSNFAEPLPALDGAWGDLLLYLAIEAEKLFGPAAVLVRPDGVHRLGERSPPRGDAEIRPPRAQIVDLKSTRTRMTAIGLAAWIAEKVHAWSDNDGDPEGVVDLDTLLTDICIYWFSDSLAASLRLYKEGAQKPFILAPGERIEPPLGMALFPRESPLPPRSWLARAFDVRRWEKMSSGGHFAALERPETLAEEVRAFFRPIRDR